MKQEAILKEMSFVQGYRGDLRMLKKRRKRTLPSLRGQKLIGSIQKVTEEKAEI